MTEYGCRCGLFVVWSQFVPNLNQSIVKSFKPQQKMYRVADEAVRGLFVKVQPGGSKSYTVRFRAQGKLREVRLGNAATLPLAKARDKAIQKLAVVSEGIDPVAEEQRAREEAERAAIELESTTLSAVIELYKNDPARSQNKSEKTIKWENEVIGRCITDKFGHRPIAEITKRELIEHRDELFNERGKTAPEEFRTVLSIIFSFAVDRDYLEYNIVRSVKRITKPAIRTRLLDDDELRLFWSWIETNNRCTEAERTALKLLFFTPARRQEIAGMLWSEIDRTRNVWLIPADRFKGKRDHVYALSKSAIDLIDSVSAQHEFVFHGNRKDDEVLREDRLSKLCRHCVTDLKMAASFGPHDMRRTISTRLTGEIGLSIEMLGIILGHAYAGSKATMHYNHYKYFKEKLDAANRWEKRITEILAEGELPLFAS